MKPTTDWSAWHDDYADPESPLSARLRVIQEHISHWLDETAPAPVRVVSSCAGDGRDLLGVLVGRNDADRVSATLLEADPRNAERARGVIERAGLDRVRVRCQDAGTTSAYAGAAPADLVLLCGIFGNIDDADVERTVAAAPQLCNPGAHLIWTRHRKPPDLTPRIRGWFAEHGFEEKAFVTPPDALFSVGVQRLVGEPMALARDERLFTFRR